MFFARQPPLCLLSKCSSSVVAGWDDGYPANVQLTPTNWLINFMAIYVLKCFVFRSGQSKCVWAPSNNMQRCTGSALLLLDCAWGVFERVSLTCFELFICSRAVPTTYTPTHSTVLLLSPSIWMRLAQICCDKRNMANVSKGKKKKEREKMANDPTIFRCVYARRPTPLSAHVLARGNSWR